MTFAFGAKRITYCFAPTNFSIACKLATALFQSNHSPPSKWFKVIIIYHLIKCTLHNKGLICADPMRSPSIRPWIRSDSNPMPCTAETTLGGPIYQVRESIQSVAFHIVNHTKKSQDWTAAGQVLCNYYYCCECGAVPRSPRNMIKLGIAHVKYKLITAECKSETIRPKDNGGGRKRRWPTEFCCLLIGPFNQTKENNTKKVEVLKWMEICWWNRYLSIHLRRRGRISSSTWVSVTWAVIWVGLSASPTKRQIWERRNSIFCTMIHCFRDSAGWEWKRRCTTRW